MPEHRLDLRRLDADAGFTRPWSPESGSGGGDAQRGGLLGKHHAVGTGESSGLLQRRCSARRRHREAEVSAEAPPRGELRGLRERIDDGASGRNAAARVAEAPEPRQGRRQGLRGAVACPQAHRRASTRGNGPRVEMKVGDRERGACHRPTSGTRGCPHLSRCSDRTYEHHQTNDEATTHQANLPRAAARVPIRNTMPLLLSIAIIVLAGLAASVPELESEPMASLSSGATNRPAILSPRMISG